MYSAKRSYFKRCYDAFLQFDAKSEIKIATFIEQFNEGGKKMDKDF